jgi:hypothetical protein
MYQFGFTFFSIDSLTSFLIGLGIDGGDSWAEKLNNTLSQFIL